MKRTLLLICVFPLLAGCYSGYYNGSEGWRGDSYYYGTGWDHYPYWHDDPIYRPPTAPESGDRIPSRPGRPGKPMQPGNPGQPTIPARPPSNIGRPVTRPTPMPRPRPAPRMAR